MTEHDARGVRNAKVLFGVSIALLIIAAGLTLAKSMRFLVGAIPDDAFYYFKIAQVYAQTGMSSFDGINPTNGYHPAWMFQIAALSKAFTDREALVRAALGLAYFWHLLTGFLIVGILKRWLPERFAWVGGACWLICANSLIVALTAVEASFYTFALALLLYTYLKLIESPLKDSEFGPSATSLALFGLALGLALIARTEAIIVAGLALPSLVWIAMRNPRLRSKGLFTAKAVAICGAAAFLVVLPWLLFSSRQIGTITQDSGVMKSLWAGLEHSRISLFHRLGGAIAGTGKVAFVWPVYFGSGRQPAGVVLAGLGCLVVLYIVLARRELARGIWLWMLFVSVFITAGYELASTAVQGWYVALPSLALFFFLYGAAVNWFLATKQSSRAERFTWPTFALFASGYLSFVLFTPRPYWDQIHLLDSQLRFEQEVPEGSLIASMNAGIPAYFSSRVRVVNVDGLVNHSIVPYWQEHRFDEYFRDKHIIYFSDAKTWLDETAEHFSRAPLKLEQIDFWPGNQRGLWKVIN